MDAAWAQAILSAIAIVVSGAFAVWVPHHERRVQRQLANQARLSIATQHHPPAGMAIEFSYVPEFWHLGINVNVEILSPKNVELRPARFVATVAPNPSGEYGHMEPAGVFLSSKGVVRLFETSGSDDLSGLLYLLPIQAPGQSIQPISVARLRVEIVTDAQEHLLTRIFTVSPIDAPFEALLAHCEARNPLSRSE